MKKINEERLVFVSNHRGNRLIVTELCVLLLVFSMKTLTAGITAFSMNDNYIYESSQMVDLVADQQVPVSGTIRDATTGELLPGVTVVVKGTSLGTLSDANGNFSISVPNRDAVLTFSFVGYTTQEMIPTFRDPMNISMSMEVTEISEVVVVGYGSQKKESVVGAITQVNNSSLVRSASPIITNAMAGKLSGVLTIQQNGEPGAKSHEIIIRGLSSWNGSQPLILVDGVERRFSNMDPNEISTISVLKDASATAVFGAKGANGVIIVTTKRGSLGAPKFDFSTSFGLSRPTLVADFIDSYTTMSMLNSAYMNEGSFTKLWSKKALEEYSNPSSRLNALRYPNVDWFDLLTNTFAPSYTANINLQGGTEFVKYFCSLGYLTEGSIFKHYNEGYLDSRYKYNKLNFRGNTDFALSKTTQLSFNLGGDINVKNSPATSPWVPIYVGSPSRFPAFFPEWVLKEVPDPDYPDATGMRRAASVGQRGGNPYSAFNNGSFNNYLGSTLFSDLIFEQKLDKVIKGLSFQGKTSLSTYYNHRKMYASYSFPEYQLRYDDIGKPGVNPWFRVGQGNEVFTLNPIVVNVGGYAADNTQYNAWSSANSGYKNPLLNTEGREADFKTELYYELAFNYINSFGKHNLTGLAMINRQQKNVGTEFPYYNEALVGRVTYDFSRKYLIEINVGYTGSERFAPSNRYGFFPSSAIGWVISEENFFKEAVPWISKLKLRYSDGLVGSDYAANRWLYMTSYYKDSNGFIVEDKGANENAQWEVARKKDLGIELGLFKNELTLSIDLFDEHRDKMILTPRNVTFLVGNTFKDLNLGQMKKHGIELEAEYKKSVTPNLYYFVKGIFGWNEDRVLYKDDPLYSPEYKKAEGKPIGAQVLGSSLTGTGYYTTIDDIHNNPSPLTLNKLYLGDMKVLDFDADGSITSADKYPIKGQYYPPINYSFSGGLTYRNFNFNFMLTGNVGKYVLFVNQWACEFYNANERVHVAQLDYWTPANQDATHGALHYDPDPGVGSFDGYIDGQYWRNSDFLRLKEVHTGYNLKSDNLNRLFHISNLYFYLSGTNLFTLTKLIEGDPEAEWFGQGFYPVMATYKIGLNVAF